MRSEGRTRVIAEQVWEGELFACLAQPRHCIVLLMTLARGTLYAEQAIHCEESHNSTFTRVHLIACYAWCVFCNIVAVAGRGDICPQLEGEVKRSREGQQAAGPASSLQLWAAILRIRGTLVSIQNQYKTKPNSGDNMQNQTRVKRTPVSIPCILNDTIAALVAVTLLMMFLKTFLF